MSALGTISPLAFWLQKTGIEVPGHWPLVVVTLHGTVQHPLESHVAHLV